MRFLGLVFGYGISYTDGLNSGSQIVQSSTSPVIEADSEVGDSVEVYFMPNSIIS